MSIEIFNSGENDINLIVYLFQMATDDYKKSYFRNHLVRLFGTPEEISRLPYDERWRVIKALEGIALDSVSGEGWDERII